MFDATYVINLDRSPERWAHAQRVTTLAGFANVIRFPGVDGASLGEAGVAALQRSGLLATGPSLFDARFRDGEMGCALSHAHVLRDIIARGWRTALILEDDVQLAGDPATWRARCAEAFQDLEPSWELWYLYRCYDIEHRVSRLTPRTLVPWTPQCAAAYGVTARGAAILLDALTPVENAVDRVYKDVVRTRAISAFAASPMLVGPAALPSLIRRKPGGAPWARGRVNRPPEYWPERYLDHLGEAVRPTPRYVRWWYAGVERLLKWIGLSSEA